MHGKRVVVSLTPRWRDVGRVHKALLILVTQVFIAVTVPLWSTSSLSQTGASSPRATLQKDYLQLVQDNPSPFGSAPITHITLQRSAFTTGFTSEVFDATVVPESNDISNSRLDQKIRMDIGGWDSSALVAFSTSNFGLGILGRGGERQVKYVDRSTTSADSSTHATGNEYFGAASYSGGGVLGYYLMSAGMLPNKVNLTFMFGTSRLAVAHKTNNWIEGGTLATYTYPVAYTHGGVDIKLELNRLFSVYFWYNYITAKEGKAKEKNVNGWRAIGGTYSDTGDILSADQELFWRAVPRQRLGIDLIATMSGLDVHLGGLLGLMGTIGTQPKYVYDKTLSLAVSYTFGA